MSSFVMKYFEVYVPTTLVVILFGNVTILA